MREHQAGVLSEMRTYLGTVGSRLTLIREENLDNIGTPDGVRHRIDLKAIF